MVWWLMFQVGFVLQEVINKVGKRQEGRVLVLGRNHMRHSIPRSLLANKHVSFFTLDNLYVSRHLLGRTTL